MAESTPLIQTEEVIIEDTESKGLEETVVEVSDVEETAPAATTTTETDALELKPWEQCMLTVKTKSADVSKKLAEIDYAKEWTWFVHKYRWVVIVFWIAMWPLGATYMPKFIDNTDSTFDAPSGSTSDIAQTLYEEQYDKSDDVQPDILVLMTREDFSEKNCNMTNSECEIYEVSKKFTEDLTTYLQDLVAEYNVEGDTDEYFASVGSYYLYENLQVPHFGELNFCTDDAQICYIGISYASPDDKREDVNDGVRDFCNDYAPEGVLVEPTGVTLFTLDTRDGTVEDMEMMDTIVLPISLFTLAYIVGNVWLVIVPVLTILTSIFFSNLLMYPISNTMQVTQFTPSIMMSLTLAMSIDYSLFLLSRLTENIAYGSGLYHGIENMLHHAGHTIIASGTTLIFCFLGFLFFPMDLLRTVGIGASVAIMVCLVVNLSLLPALMFVSGKKFLSPGEKASKLCCNEEGNPGRYRMRSIEDFDTGDGPPAEAFTHAKDQEVTEGETTSSGSNPLTESLIPKEPSTDLSPYLDLDTQNDVDDMRASIWYKSGRVLLSEQGPYILAGLCLLMAPFCYFWVETGNSLEFDLFLPKSCDSRTAYDHYGDAFGKGQLAPYKLIFSGNTTNYTVYDPELFEVMDTVITALTSDPDEFSAAPDLFYYSGIYSLNGTQISYEEYMDALKCGSNCEDENKRTINFVAMTQNSPYETSTYSDVVLNVDSYSNDGTDWLVAARDTLDDLESQGKLMGYEVVLQNGAGIMYDSVQEVYDCFPMLIGVTLTMVYILVSFFFKSLTAPLRSVFTIGITLMFCYGLAVLVYQYGWLDWLGFDSVGDTGEIAWLPPLMVFSIIVGLGLDYDIFLASRVLEFRLLGYDEDSSILKGLYKTGGIITAAGTIMAVAFGGLIFASELLLNQFGFYIFVAVIMDTFVVRTIMVPILMGASGKYTWWPQQLPPETTSWDQPDSIAGVTA